jgi:ribose 5-phosphate isomerase B
MSHPLVFLAADHRGFLLKSKVISFLSEKKFQVRDLGTNSEDRCDASDFANTLATEMAAGQECVGILICGTGQAMAMMANRYQHLRAALCANATVARLTREHNDANVLVLGADITGMVVAMDCVDVFLSTKFLGGRYAERRDKLTAMGGL